jgi:hypothetical protein
MGKKSTSRKHSTGKASTGTAGSTASAATDVPVVGAREPCPCGSGRRYKACHGRSAARAAEEFVHRPFEGLVGECDWIAMREIVPAATATLSLAGDHGDRSVTAATVLPMAWPGLVRQDGTVLVGLQVQGGSGDASRDIANALELALAAEPGTPIAPNALPGAGPRLQDLLDPAAALDVVVHPGFDFWLDGNEERTPEVIASMERANEAVVPTVRLQSVEAAYWCEIRGRYHLRWVVPHEEEALLDAIARLHASGADTVGEGSRYVGSFRAHGLAVPVWDLAEGTPAEALEEPVTELGTRLAEALADTTPLDADARRARAGLASRQVTLR